MASTYDIGDVVRITADFSQLAAAIDPDSVALHVRTPDGVTTIFLYGTDEALEKVEVGSYAMDFVPSMNGVHWYRWVSSGDGASAEQGWFLVQKPFGGI